MHQDLKSSASQKPSSLHTLDSLFQVETPPATPNHSMNPHVASPPIVPPPSRHYFPKIKEAREALKGRALEIYDLYMRNIQDAMAEGEHEVAAKSLQWLMEHMPTSEEGETMIDSSIDKVKQVDAGPKGPTIQLIGISLGGTKVNDALAPIVDVHAIPSHD